MSIKFDLKGKATGIVLDEAALAKQKAAQKYLEGDKKKPITSDELNRWFKRW